MKPQRRAYGRMAMLAGVWMVPILIGALLGMRGVTGQEEPPVEADWEVLNQVRDMIDQYYVEEPTNDEIEMGAVRGVLHSLDPYCEYFSAESAEQLRRTLSGEFVGIGVQVELTGGLVTVVTPLDGSPAFHAGLRTGDILLEVEGTSLRGLTLTEVGKLVRGEKGTTVSIKLFKKSTSSEQDVDIVRDSIELESVKEVDLIGAARNILYVRISEFQGTTVEQMERKIKPFAEEGFDYMIIDLRSNPGGSLEACLSLCDRFLDDTQEIVSVRGRGGKRLETHFARPGNELPLVPTVILLNEGSASASELFTACLQDHGLARVVGQRSYGKGSVQRIFSMDEEKKGALLKLTIARYYSPAGRSVHRTEEERGGIIPDLEIELSDEEVEKIMDYRGDYVRGLAEERHIDPQLAAAIELVQKPLEDAAGTDAEPDGNRTE